MWDLFDLRIRFVGNITSMLVKMKDIYWMHYRLYLRGELPYEGDSPFLDRNHEFSYVLT